MTSTLPNDNIKNFDEKITNKLISEIIRDRIKSKGTRFSANDNIADFINPGELKVLEKEVASRIRDLLKSLVIDCLLYTSPSPRDATLSRMPSSA